MNAVIATSDLSWLKARTDTERLVQNVRLRHVSTSCDAPWARIGDTSMSDPDTPKGDVTLQAIAMPWDANVGGDIFGGWLMSQMDLGASVIARQRALGRTATVACEGMQFHRPVLIGDLVSIHARLTNEGRSSMRIAVEVWVRRKIYEDHLKVTEAVFTFCALDEDGKTRALPAVPEQDPA